MTVAVDGSPPAEAGVALALRLADPDTILFFCNVVDPMSVYALTALPLDPSPSPEELHAVAQTICQDGVQMARSQNLSAHAMVVEGHPANGLLRCAEQNHSDAIVIGSHGRSGIVRAAVGSITEEIVRRSEVPVAVAHVGDAVRRGPLAVAVDASPPSAAALQTAIALARASGDELALFHALQHLDGIDALGQGNPERDDALRNAAGAILDRAAAHARASGVRSTSTLLEGNPAAELLGAIERQACAAAFVGTHGRSEWERLVFGSVAAALIEHARVPVFVTRMTAAKET